MDLENGSGVHHRCKVTAYNYKTTNVSFSPGLFSIPQIVDTTIDLLDKEGKVKDT